MAQGGAVPQMSRSMNLRTQRDRAANSTQPRAVSHVPKSVYETRIDEGKRRARMKHLDRNLKSQWVGVGSGDDYRQVPLGQATPDQVAGAQFYRRVDPATGRVKVVSPPVVGSYASDMDQVVSRRSPPTPSATVAQPPAAPAVAAIPAPNATVAQPPVAPSPAAASPLARAFGAPTGPAAAGDPNVDELLARLRRPSWPASSATVAQPTAAPSPATAGGPPPGALASAVHGAPFVPDAVPAGPAFSQRTQGPQEDQDRANAQWGAYQQRLADRRENSRQMRQDNLAAARAANQPAQQDFVGSMMNSPMMRRLMIFHPEQALDFAIRAQQIQANTGIEGMRLAAAREAGNVSQGQWAMEQLLKQQQLDKELAFRQQQLNHMSPLDRIKMELAQREMQGPDSEQQAMDGLQALAAAGDQRAAQALRDRLMGQLSPGGAQSPPDGTVSLPPLPADPETGLVDPLALADRVGLESINNPLGPDENWADRLSDMNVTPAQQVQYLEDNAPGRMGRGIDSLKLALGLMNDQDHRNKYQPFLDISDRYGRRYAQPGPSLAERLLGLIPEQQRETFLRNIPSPW